MSNNPGAQVILPVGFESETKTVGNMIDKYF